MHRQYYMLGCSEDASRAIIFHSPCVNPDAQKALCCHDLCFSLSTKKLLFTAVSMISFEYQCFLGQHQKPHLELVCQKIAHIYFSILCRSDPFVVGDLPKMLGL